MKNNNDRKMIDPDYYWEYLKPEHRNFKGFVQSLSEIALWEAMGEYGYGLMPVDIY